MKISETILVEKEKRSFFQTYNRFPFVPKEASAHLIWDEDGTCYFDFISGLGVNLFGHCHPKINEAIKLQIDKFSHLSNYFYQEPQINFVVKLKEMTGMDRVFLANSGTEANEGATKLCRKWGNYINKTEIIAFTGGFHGRTYGSLSLMNQEKYKKNMGPWLSNINIIEYNNSEALESAVSEKTAGIILEFLQGEGGVIEASEEFVATIERLREKYNFLIIADEIQTGAGRTGSFFSFDKYSITPDIVTIAKGIGGGLPLGAILAKEKLAKVWELGSHGTTCGGNALACAAGLVILKELEHGLIDISLAVGTHFKKSLLDLKTKFPNKILEVRGRGLMLGLVLSFDANILVKSLFENYNIITNATSGNVLRLLPALIISRDDVDLFMDSLRECLSSL